MRAQGRRNEGNDGDSGAQRRLLRRLLVALAVGCVLLALLRAALPWLSARGLECWLDRDFGLPLHIANVDFWLVRGQVALEGVRLGRRGGAGPEGEIDPERALLRARRVYAHLDWSDLLERRLRVRDFVVDSGRVRVVQQEDGSIDALGEAPEPGPGDVAEEAGPTAEEADGSETEPEGGDEGGWTFAVDRLSLANTLFQIAEPGGASARLEFALEALQLTDVALEGEDVSLGGVGLSGPVLLVRRDFRLPPAQPESEEAEDEASASSLVYRASRIAIDGAEFTWITAETSVDVTLGVAATDVTTQAGASFPLALHLELGDALLVLDGKLALDPVLFEGQLTWSDLALPQLAVIAEPDLAPWIRSCRAGGDLAVAVRLAPEPDGAGEPGVRLEGRVEVDSLSLADPGGSDIGVDWKDLDIRISELFVPFGSPDGPSPPIRVALERVRLAEPSVRYALPADALDAILGGGEEDGGAEPEEASSESPAPVNVTVASLDVSGGTLRFEDATVSPPYVTRVKDLRLQARSVRWPDLRAEEVSLAAEAPTRAAIGLQGSLADGTGRFDLDVDRLALPPFNPYATSAAGYRVQGGDGSLAARVGIRGARYDIDSKLVLHDLAVSGTGNGTFEKVFGIPLDLALSLLRDLKGDISLPIDVSFDEGGASTALAGPVVAALRQALVGAVTAPLKILGAGAMLAFGKDGGMRVEPLAAVPGSAELAAGERKEFDALGELLETRPDLGLELRGRAGPEDVAPLAAQILVERVGQGEPLPEIEDAGFFARRRVGKALEERARGKPGKLDDPEDRALLERYVAAVQVPQERLYRLAQERAERARERLRKSHDLPEARVTTGDPAAAGAPAVLLSFRPVE